MSLSSVPDDIDLKIKNENKEANLQSEIYSPILLELSKHSYIKLENLINDTSLSSNLSERQIIEAVFILIGKGVLNPSLHLSDKSTKARCRAINNHFLEASQYVDHFKHFASSNSCGAIVVSKIEQLFLLALSMGHTKSKEVVDFVIKNLKAQSQKLSVPGTELKNQDQERQELAKQFNDFNAKRLKFLKQRIDL